MVNSIIAPAFKPGERIEENLGFSPRVNQEFLIVAIAEFFISCNPWLKPGAIDDIGKKLNVN